jgi:hypothetical protein
MIMKKCSFCAKDIQDDAIKCKHCGEFLDASTSPRFAEEKIQRKEPAPKEILLCGDPDHKKEWHPALLPHKTDR